MTTTQHTPGPWNYDEYNGSLWITDDSGIGTIAQLIPEPNKGIWDEDKANARLIAAAPELLAALQSLIQYLPEEDIYYEDASAYRQISAAVERAEGVIAKATAP